jgi:hypothetical protein
MNLHPGLHPHELDVRNRQEVADPVKLLSPHLLVAASQPFDDCDVNAVGTVNLSLKDPSTHSDFDLL